MPTDPLTLNNVIAIRGIQASEEAQKSDTDGVVVSLFEDFDEFDHGALFGEGVTLLRALDPAELSVWVSALRRGRPPGSLGS